MHTEILAVVPGSGGAVGPPCMPRAQLRLLGSPAPTSLAAGAHEPRRADAFANMVVADAAVQAVGTVLLAGRSPFPGRAGCGESGGAQAGTRLGAGYGCRSPCPREPGPRSPRTIRR